MIRIGTNLPAPVHVSVTEMGGNIHLRVTDASGAEVLGGLLTVDEAAELASALQAVALQVACDYSAALGPAALAAMQAEVLAYDAMRGDHGR